ncbi:MAG: NAD(P)/FAD-dependent oxidoreductase [Elusimicrobiota bacterium]|nr:NAD(P)/FAD-dependent oxidoreductase [Elusimicrobiota bacterium]
MEKIDTAVIGGGAVGLAVACSLAEEGKDIFLFEKNPYLGDEQSGRNSGVIHAGLYYRDYPLKKKLCVEGNRLLYGFCEKNNVPFSRTGKFIVAVNAEEDKMIDRYIDNARDSGAEGVERVSPGYVREKEPNVNVYSALTSPSTGILDAADYIKCLERRALAKGVEIMTSTKVTGITSGGSGFIVEIEEGGRKAESAPRREEFTTEKIINSAGLYSDEIAGMINPENAYKIIPVRGEYYSFDSSARNELSMNGTNIYPVQKEYFIDGVKHMAIGIHLTPVFDIASGRKIMGKKILVGPTSNAVSEKEDLEKDRAGAECFYEGVKDFFPGIKAEDLKMDYAGNRAKLGGGGDFIIERDSKYGGAVNLVGIESPGLTASLAIGEFVKKLFFG